ncbi:thiamine pyrophosphokinase [Bifidobacterium goeldii]|uniref:Thiamine diphosphokinase n=2 Tax=Bifidobacterium goeldii TaxID=2306975 RepID=A0A430FN25_9BIFI|nr:thiamine pyrophosphokinase [Bifidobacterium goeldii]
MVRMSEQTCVIFAAGEYYGDTPIVPSGALVIAADGGLDHTRALGIEADFVIGDFDSLTSSVPHGSNTLRLPSQKDDPDLLSALKVGWNRGARQFRIYGALGGRIDHTIASIQLTALLAQHGGVGFLYGDGMIVTAVSDARLDFAARHVDSTGDARARMVSVFAHSSDAQGVSERGLKYELTDATLTNTIVQGVSNELLDERAASIDVRQGTLIVTFPSSESLPRITRHHAFTGDLGALDTTVSSALAV